MGNGPALEMARRKDIAQYDLNLLPWAGVAVRLGGAKEAVACEGRAFVFLPLPILTGLPVHLNGFFELSENRRELWYADAGMTGGGRARSGMLVHTCG